MTIEGDGETLEFPKSQLQKAESGFDSVTNNSVVYFRFTDKGSSKFGAFTTRHVNKAIKIKVCGELITSPIIREPILGGTGMLSGNFTIQDATELASKLNTGKCN